MARLRELGIISAQDAGDQLKRRTAIERPNILKLAVCASLLQHDWNYRELKELVDRDFAGALAGFDDRPWLGLPSALGGAPDATALERQIAHDIVRWVAGFLVCEDEAALTQGERLGLIARRVSLSRLPRRGASADADMVEDALEPDPVSRGQMEGWCDTDAPAILCSVDGATSSFRVWSSLDLGQDLEDDRFPDSDDRCYLYSFEDPFDDAEWQLLVSVRNGRLLRKLTSDEHRTSVLLLRIASALMPEFQPEPIVPRLRILKDRLGANQRSPLQAHFQQNPALPFASLAHQLADVPNALASAVPFWRGAVLLVAPDALQPTKPIGSQQVLHALACTRDYSPRVVQLSALSLTTTDALSVRAFLQQQSCVVENPRPSDLLLFEEEAPSLSAALPIGIAEHRAAVGVLYAYSQQLDTSSLEDALRATKILSLVIGGAIRNFVARSVRERELEQTISSSDSFARLDVLTRWETKDSFATYLATSDEHTPLIMLHVQMQQVRRVSALADLLALAANRIDTVFKKLRVNDARVFALDRATYAIALSPDDRKTARRFYEIKTELARAMRSISAVDASNRNSLIWVRAGVISTSDLPRATKAQLVDYFVDQQNHYLLDVFRLEDALLNQRFDEADNRLATLEKVSPSSRLRGTWDDPDPAIVIEKGRVLTLRATHDTADEDLTKARALFKTVPPTCRTGLWRREYGYCLKRSMDFAFERAIGRLLDARKESERISIASRAFEDVELFASQLSDALAELLHTDKSSPNQPVLATQREAARILVEADALRDAVRARFGKRLS